VRKAAERRGGNMAKLNWMTKACGVLLVWAAAAVALPAQSFITLVNFDYDNGASPADVSLIQGLDGSFYGTTYYGGAHGEGTVFNVAPDGTLTTLYSFCSQTNCADGDMPASGLALGNDGDLYGATWQGGLMSAPCDVGGGCGTVFKITPRGSLTTLVPFDQVNDGASPFAALLQATDGYFYGTTVGGLTEFESGTIFKMTPDGSLTTLYIFPASAYGGTPYSAPVQATDGRIYGTTFYGGANEGGQVFEITPTGTFTTLYSFCSQVINNLCADGRNPTGLIQGKDGSLYGATDAGGTSTNCPDFGCGTVFKLTLSGVLTSLHSFDGSDGSSIFGPVIEATDGNLYGTASRGGNMLCYLDLGCGSIFEITRSGTFTTLHIFDSDDGAAPEGGLVQGTNGTLYGTTEEGGAIGYGTVFSLNVGLGQFVETLPTSGKVGMTVKILGSFLTGATSVTFNGTPATFTVNSKSEITATVPTGATTGTVQVVSPRLGTLSSNVPFRVLP
jgi:uncharacterized repeat protein (TIGR03803 family)